MVATAERRKLSFAEYLATEGDSLHKREWLNGEILARTEGTLLHSAVSGAALGALRDALVGRPCRPFNSDARIRVPDTGLAAYPDVSVVCGPVQRDAEDHEAIVNPVVIVEVLSPSTKSWDRGGKASHYRRLATLRHLVLLDPDSESAELYTRLVDGSWNLRDLGPDDVIPLPAIDVTLSLGALYAEGAAAVG